MAAPTGYLGSAAKSIEGPVPNEWPNLIITIL